MRNNEKKKSVSDGAHPSLRNNQRKKKIFQKVRILHSNHFFKMSARTRHVNRFGAGRHVVRITTTGLTSGDVPRIMTIIEREVKRVGNPVYGLGGVSLFSLMGVRLEGGVFRSTGFHPTTKTFDFRPVRDWRGFSNALLAYSQGFMNSAGYDYSFNIHEIVFTFVSSIGGCRQVRMKVEMLQIGSSTLRFFPNRTPANECFFALIIDLVAFPWRSSKRKAILSRKASTFLRSLVNIRHRDKLTAAEALEIYDAVPFRPNVAKHPLFIYVDDIGRWLPHRPPDFNNEDKMLALLKDEHFYTFSALAFVEKCQRCYKTYQSKHSCVADLYEKCTKCGGYHEGTCNKKRFTYYQSQILETESRYLLIKSKEKPIQFDDLIHYDMETYPGENRLHRVYAIGYVYQDEYVELFGENALSEFVDLLLRLKSRVILNAFNGANFDHYFIVRELIRRNIPIERFKLNNGAIISGRFGKVKFFDLCKHVQGSLRANLIEWGCDVTKGDFDHEKGGRWEDMTDEVKEECKVYLKADVMGLKELYEKLATNVHELYGVRVSDFISTSQLTYYNWSQNISSECPIFLPSIALERASRTAIFGGRTYPTKRHFLSNQRTDYLSGAMGFEDVDDYVVDLDVVSLYPSAMMYDYPVGAFTYLTARDRGRLNRMMRARKVVEFVGVFHIHFEPNRNLAHAILPRRTEKGLQWTLESGSGFYTSVDIETALNYGYIITITEVGGFLFEKSDPIFKPYIKDLFQMKSDSVKGSARYILAKLAMNGLYGKLIQRPILDEVKMCKTNTDVFKFARGKAVHEVVPLEDLLYVRATANDISETIERITKPSYLGAFVLAYSRRIMIEYMDRTNPNFANTTNLAEADTDFYYTDTDSIQIHASRMIPQTKELGGITDDLGEGCKILRGYWIAPKLYMLEYIIKNDDLPRTACESEHCGRFKYAKCTGTIHYHFRGKGVPGSKLNVAIYEDMYNDKPITIKRDFQMKKIGPKLNSKQQHLDIFSILHKHADETARTLNTTRWAGRNFISPNRSVPHGHSLT